ncbi:MAG: glycosyltransferase [Bacteroidetes bacterium]|nr:glycosyltransferase [Bacteroidota bacterium]
MKKNKTILVAPLHWGLGHATRCIPIIQNLLKEGFDVLLASDGAALRILQKEFPELPCLALPSYNITYPKKGVFFKLHIFFKLPKLKRTVRAEHKVVKELVSEGKIHGIISDNRMGIRHKKVPSIFITHQINVLSGNTSFFSTKMHQNIINKFDACWVPDVENGINLSGKLGHSKKIKFPITYIGPLSRMQKRNIPIIYDVLILLSGPEPQRTLLEVKMLECFLHSGKKVLLVRGVLEDTAKMYENENITIVNFMQTELLEKSLNESEVVVSRSGYTTIMDLANLEKPAFFIPTPGQYEQKYLAKQLKRKGIAPSCSQEKFTLAHLNQIPMYTGLKAFKNTVNFEQLFRLFEGK